MDITYIPMARGFVYLAVVLDWFSRRVLSWRLSITMEAAFCVETLEDAMAHHGKPEIFNTDQDCETSRYGAVFERLSYLTRLRRTGCLRRRDSNLCISKSDLLNFTVQTGSWA